MSLVNILDQICFRLIQIGVKTHFDLLKHRIFSVGRKSLCKPLVEWPKRPCFWPVTGQRLPAVREAPTMSNINERLQLKLIESPVIDGS